MTYYDLSFMDNVTTMNVVVKGVNDNSGGWLGGAFLLGLFLLIFMVYSQYETKDVILGDAFICTLVGGALYGMGALAFWALLIPVVVLISSLIIKLWSDA